MEKWKNILIVVLCVIIGLFIVNTTCIRDKKSKLEHNIEALTDSMQVIQLKNGELLAAKQSLILEKSELEEYLDISNKERRTLERQLNSSLATISKIQSEIRVDTLVCHDSVYIDNNQQFVSFDFNDPWMMLTGETRCIDTVCHTSINHLSMNVPLTLGYTKDKQIYVVTDNPYVVFGSIESAVLNKSVKPKHWNIGLQVSAVSVQYDLIHKTVGIGPSLGVGLSFGYSF